MDTTPSVPENVKVILRIRPRVDTLPAHPQHQIALNNSYIGHDPDCVCVLGKHQVKLLPPTHCRCDACFSKTMTVNNVAEKFGTASGREKKEKIFQFETILGPERSQEDVYSTLADTVSSSVLGFNATIFAYGSAGSGKTYTMTGTRTQPGVIPRVIDDIFRNIQQARARGKDVMFHVELSYIEMYNNGFRNLLRPVSDEVGRVEAVNGNSDLIQSELDELLQLGVSEAAFEAGVSRFVDLSHKLDKITVHEGVATGVYLCGPNIRIPVTSPSGALRLFAIGNKQRAETAKKMNDRSHAVLTIHVESKVVLREGRDSPVDNPEHTSFAEKKSGRDTPTAPVVRSELRLGKIHLVDLAGSERLSETKAEGEAMTEAQNINKSLLALGEVLHALALNASIQQKNVRKRLSGGFGGGEDSGSSSKSSGRSRAALSHLPEPPAAGEVHVPYLNSKLTHLLKDSLGGNSKTVMITNVGSEVEQYHHILQTLTYATRAMKVRNTVRPVRVEIGESEVIPDLSNERDIINQLKERVLNRSPNGRPLPRHPSVARMPPPLPLPSSSGGSLRGASPSSRARTGSTAGSVSTLNTQGSFSARGVRPPSPLASPARPNRLPPSSKIYTLKLSGIQARDLAYVSFPLCPILKFRVDKQESVTSKNLYSRSLATFPESFEFEVGVLKYKSGTDLEVEAANISSLTGEVLLIGGGRVDVQSVLPALNNHQSVTIPLLSEALQPAGVIVVGAVLLDRPMANAVSYPTPMHGNGAGGDTSPFSPSAMLRDAKPQRDRDGGVQNAVFRVERIVCYDMSRPVAARPLGSRPEGPKSDIFVVVEVAGDSLRTDPMPSKVKHNNVHVTFERPSMVFDVDHDQLPSETLYVAVYEVPRSSGLSAKQCAGRAQAPLYSLTDRDDSVYTPASEFAMQLNDDDGEPVGKVSLFLHLSKNHQPLEIDTTGSGLFASPPRSPSRSAMGSPTKHLRSMGMSPRLNNIRVPSSFHTGWIRISSIAATNLNKFRLVGNTARYKHLRDAPMTPVPAYLKHSELFGKQDPFVVIEAGEFWGSYSKVLLNQGWNCQWDQAAFCCFLSQVEASEQNLRVSVYDRSCSGYHNVFIGSASVPLINFFATTRRTRELSVDLTVVDRRGKANGKLELRYTWEASDEKERWSNGIVTRVCGDGCYDIRYDDGEEEFSVHKDVIRLVARPKATSAAAKATPPSAQRFGFGISLFHVHEGARVEVNDQGRGLWFPAEVVRDNRDGTYDVESAYDIVKSAIGGDNIRTIEGEGVFFPDGDSPLERRLNFEDVNARPGQVKNKFKLRELVEGNYHSKGTWYVGRICKVHQHDQYYTYDVDYLTGEFESEVAEDMIRYESTRVVPEDAMSAYDLRALRAHRAESNVEVPLHRTVGGVEAAKARAAAAAGLTKSKFQAGQQVEVNYRGHGRYYVGTVEVDYENGLYDILYETGERDEDVAEDLIRAPQLEQAGDVFSPEKRMNLLGSLRQYKFEVGDRVEANFREIGKFIPGIITRDRGHGVFDIHYYDGRDETKVNFEHIRFADTNVLFSPAQRPAKYAVGQCVECNCERLGVWYHALIRNVLDNGLYNIQYDDGETEYDVEEDMLRPGGAYSPGIPSLKPFFKVGDRVKVACRSPEVEHELRTLSAIKQRILDERKRLAEGKLVVAKRNAMQEGVNDTVANAHRALQGFKTRVGYSGDLTCCQAEKNEGAPGGGPRLTTGVSDHSFRQLDEIETVISNPASQIADRQGDGEPVETLNDAITKAIVVEQSLGHIARSAKEDELAKAHSAHLLSITEKEKADELALSRALDEEKARKRNNFSREEELKVMKEALQKAELELSHIMAARQLVLEQDEALKLAKQKADLEAKCILSAQRKGERAAARLKEEDRLRLASGDLVLSKDGRAGPAGKLAAHHLRHSHHKDHHHGQQQTKESPAVARVQRQLGADVARERDALRKALVRVKEADDELTLSKARAEQAGKEYAAADAAAQNTLSELQMVLDTNRQAEQTLTEDSTLTSEFNEYRSAAEAIAAYSAQANSKKSLKVQNVHKAEAAASLRARKEETAAVAGEKRLSAEESIVLSARNGAMEDAKCAMREANGYSERQGDDIWEATDASNREAAELVKAKAFAEEERRMYASARDIAVLASGLLRVIIADQREREYGALHAAKAAAQSLLDELEALRQEINEEDLHRINTAAAAQTEALAIAQFRSSVSTVRTTTTTITVTSSSLSTVERTALSLKIVKAQSGRETAEEEIQRLSQERMVVEERARVTAKKCEIEESIAMTCAQDDAVKDAPVDRFHDQTKREQLHHFNSYSADECKAVRTALAHVEEQCAALREAKASALQQLRSIDTCRQYLQEEFSALSSLSVVEREELRPSVHRQPVEVLQRQLAEAKVRALDAGHALFEIKQKATDGMKGLLSSKEVANDVLEQLARAQTVTQHIAPRDFSVDRTKASIVEGAQLAVRTALADAVVAEKARQAAEDSARVAQQASDELARNASDSERLRSREEETLRLAMTMADGISADDEDQRLALTAAIIHTEAEVQALHDAAAFVEREIADLVAAKTHSEVEGRAVLLALAKEETILLAKAEWDQQKTDAELAIAKKLLDGRVVLLNDAQNDLERHVLALDVMVSTLERAAKELVARGDDDIDECRAYQREFKRMECKKQKAAEFRQRKENKKSKAEHAREARDAEEDGAVATEARIYELERAAAQAELNDNPDSEVKALREARRLCEESTNALLAAKEYAVAEEELYVEAQDEAEEERMALAAARDHAEEAWRLLAKALSELPVKHRTCMGLMLLNGGDGHFKGVPVKPRKRPLDSDGHGRGKYNADFDPFNPLAEDGDDVNGNTALRAADFKGDNELPDRDRRDLSFLFEANPMKAALRAALDDVDKAYDLLDAAKGRTDDAQMRYRVANAAAEAEGEAVYAQEEDNAAMARRLHDNYMGVEAEYEQLQQVRADLVKEDGRTADLRAAKESEVDQVKPVAQARAEGEDLAAAHEANCQKALEAAERARANKDHAGAEKALADARKHCQLQAVALKDAAQAADKECSAWDNGTEAADKEHGSAEKAHALANEEARLLALIRAAQLHQGKDVYDAACSEADAAKDAYDETFRGIDGFSDLVDGLKANNDEREAELSEETKELPAYGEYREVRDKFQAESERAQAAHALHNQEVAKALAARQAKEEAGTEAEELEGKRLETEAAADDAHSRGDRPEEQRLSEEAQLYESGVGDAYQYGTQCANEETAAWNAAAQHLEEEKEALTAAHGVSLDANALLVQLRADQIKHEHGALGDANQLALDCANDYDIANSRATRAAVALLKARTLLQTRESQLGANLKSIPDYQAYTELLDAANNADEQAKEFQQEKLKERAAVDATRTVKQRDEQAAIAAGTQRAVAAAAVLEAQRNDDVDAEQRAMEDLNRFSSEEEVALLSAKENALKEAHLWGVATDFATEEASARITAKDNVHEAIRLLNAGRLSLEYEDLERKKAELAEAEQSYRESRKAVAEAKAKTPALVAAAKMPEDDVSAEARDSLNYEKYVRRANTVAADANRPVIDFDVINAVELERAKVAGASRVKEEQKAAAAVGSRTEPERVAADFKAAEELENEIKAVEEANGHVDSEDKAVLAATQFARDEVAIWKNLKVQSDNELKVTNSLNERAMEAAKLLGELMMNEKDRLAEAVVQALDAAAKVESVYFVTNKKTVARASTLAQAKARSEAAGTTLHEDCKETAEYQRYQALLPRHEPLSEQAGAIKSEKEELVASAEALKAKRTALELEFSRMKQFARGNSVRELAAKFEKTDVAAQSKRAAQLAEVPTEALQALLATAKEEAELWSRATECTTREKDTYTGSVAIFEETLLLQAVAAANLHERTIMDTLHTAAAAADKAKADFYAACEGNEEADRLLTASLESKDAVLLSVRGTDPAVLSSPAFVRVQDKLAKEASRISAARAEKEKVVAKATKLIEARQAEEAFAAECTTQYRRVVVAAVPAAALPRLDRAVCAVPDKPKSVTGAADDIPDQPPAPFPADVSDGEQVTWPLLRAVFPHFGAYKRDKVTDNTAMRVLAAERTYAEKQESALEKATRHAAEEERAWRLALQQAMTEADALTRACAAAEEAEQVLSGLKNDINEQEQAALDGACADADRGREQFERTSGECADLSRAFEERKEVIITKDSEITAISRETATYRKFLVLNGQLRDTDEPAIMKARTAKESAAKLASQLAATKEAELAAANSAVRERREADAKRARMGAVDAASKETAAWEEANRHAVNEAGLLKSGVDKEDAAIKLLVNVKADQDQRENDELDGAVADAEATRGLYGASFQDAERKHALYTQEKRGMQDREAEIVPDARGAPEFKKFEKLKAELEDDDEPFIFSKRADRMKAAKHAEDLVVAHRRNQPSVEAAAEEKGAWQTAIDLSDEEVACLDRAIDKAQQAQELLVKANLDTLTAQGGEGEAGLYEARRASAARIAALKQLEERIAETRSKLSKLQDENQTHADAVRGKGPEFEKDVAAHEQTVRSIATAIASAESHRVSKETNVSRASVSRKSADDAERVYTKGTPLPDATAEAARRRDALVSANSHAHDESVHIDSATKDAESELAELLKAHTAAKAIGEQLQEASTKRAYRTRMGYLLMGGDEDLIPIPKSQPFAGVTATVAGKKFIDGKRMKRPQNHEDEEVRPPSRRLVAACEVSCDTYDGEAFRDAKVLFEVGGGWTSTVATQAMKHGPYRPPVVEEYMPARPVTKEVSVVAAQSRRGAKKQSVASAGFYHAEEAGEASAERLRGKALFIAVVKHLMRLNRVVRTLKPLAEGELEALKEKIEVAEQAAQDTTEFLVDTSLLQSKAGKILHEGGILDLAADSTAEGEEGKERVVTPVQSAANIAVNIASFLETLERHDSLVESETASSSEEASGRTAVVSTKKGGFAALTSTVVKAKKLRPVKIAPTPGTDVAQFKERKQVEFSSISTLLFGGLTASVDVAVLEEEGEDVVEHVKETTRSTTQVAEKSEEHTTEEVHEEQSEVLQTSTVMSAQQYYANGHATTAAAYSASSANQTHAAAAEASGPVPMQMPAPVAEASNDDGFDDFGTTYDDFGTGYDDQHDADDWGQFPSPSTSVDGNLLSPIPEGPIKLGGSKKIKKTGSNNSVTSGGSRSNGSAKRKPDSAILAEMMSGNVDI